MDSTAKEIRYIPDTRSCSQTAARSYKETSSVVTVSEIVATLRQRTIGRLSSLGFSINERIKVATTGFDYFRGKGRIVDLCESDQLFIVLKIAASRPDFDDDSNLAELRFRMNPMKLLSVGRALGRAFIPLVVYENEPSEPLTYYLEQTRNPERAWFAGKKVPLVSVEWLEQHDPEEILETLQLFEINTAQRNIEAQSDDLHANRVEIAEGDIEQSGEEVLMPPLEFTIDPLAGHGDIPQIAARYGTRAMMFITKQDCDDTGDNDTSQRVTERISAFISHLFGRTKPKDGHVSVIGVDIPSSHLSDALVRHPYLTCFSATSSKESNSFVAAVGAEYHDITAALAGQCTHVGGILEGPFQLLMAEEYKSAESVLEEALRKCPICHSDTFEPDLSQLHGFEIPAAMRLPWFARACPEHHFLMAIVENGGLTGGYFVAPSLHEHELLPMLDLAKEMNILVSAVQSDSFRDVFG